MSLRKEFYRHVLPSMLSFALSGIYAIVDGFFIGNSIGDAGLAAIGIAYPITALIQSAGTGIGMGGAIRFSISQGEGHFKERNQFFGLTLMALAGAGLLLAALLGLGCAPLFHFMGAQGEIYSLGLEYLRIIVMGTVFQVLATGLVPLIRNMGGSFFAMTAMICGFLTNIALDYLLVWVLPWGMAGAAAATVVGQGVTLVLGAAFLASRRRELAFSIRDAHWRGRLTKLLRIAPSPFGLAFVPNVTLILVNKSAVIHGGDFAVTCYAAINYISCVILLLLQGISDGSQPLISLFSGQGQSEHMRAVRSMAYRFSLLAALVSAGLLFLARRHIGGLFGTSEQVAAQVGQVLPLFLTGFLFVSLSRITTSFFYATEQNRRAYSLIYGEPLALLALLLTLPATAGLIGTWLCVPLSQAAAALAGLWLLKKSEPGR